MKPVINLKGFTLIEILVSLVILSFSLLALAGLMVTTTRNNSFGGRVTEAATFAQDKLEEFRAIPWGSVLSGTDNKTGSHNLNYQRNWAVVTSADGNLKTITISINWTDRNPHTIQLVSVVNKVD